MDEMNVACPEWQQRTRLLLGDEKMQRLHRSHVLVVGLGGYKFNDYVKSGMPMILIAFVICMVLLPILYPFFP